MDKSWSVVINELQAAGMTYAQIGEAIGSAGSTVGDLATGRSQSPRAAAAMALLRLHAARCGDRREDVVIERRQLIDSRMTKRALRTRLGLSSDVLLAKVLKLPAEQVASWPEEGALPALPQITNLLGHQEPAQAGAAPQDPDESRIVTVEVA